MSYKGKASLHFNLPSQYSSHVQCPLLGKTRNTLGVWNAHNGSTNIVSGFDSSINLYHATGYEKRDHFMHSRIFILKYLYL